MQRFIKSVFLFSISMMVGYYILIIIWATFLPSSFSRNLDYRLGSDDFMFTRTREVKQVSDIDLLIVGSSHAYQSFDTRIFNTYGFSAFNLGSNVQTPIQTNVLLHRYLESLNPHTIIYEVYPVTFQWDGVRSALTLIANDVNDINSIKMAWEVSHMKVYNTLLYGFYRDLFNLNSSFVDDYPGRRYISGGFVEKEMKYLEYMDHPEKRNIIDDDQLDAFERNVALIKNKQIRLILVYAPITTSLYNSYINNEEFDSLMHTYGEYHNFNSNELITLDDSLHFDDDDHLNQRGVEIFNEKFIQIIQE